MANERVMVKRAIGSKGETVGNISKDLGGGYLRVRLDSGDEADFHKSKVTVVGPSQSNRTVGNTPMPTAGVSQAHGYGHTASQRDGALRLSGNPKAHRIGKR